MQLIATVGDPAANSYCTVAEATSLLPATIHEDLLTDTFQIQLSDALIWATRLIEEQVAWHWTPATTTQALSWPLDGATDLRGRAISTATIPQFLKIATAEYALALLRMTPQLPQLELGRYLQRLTTTDVTVEFRESLPPTVEAHMPVAVRRMLRPYGDVAGDTMVRLVRT